MNKVELLAPAGDLERIKIAIRYGADAVYCGGKFLSLRSRAGNLELEEIKEAVEFANKYGAKIYITVNMMPHDADLVMVKDYLKNLYEIGVSAIIVSSLYILKLAKEIVPLLPVHISTQQNTLNSLTVRYWKSLGASRVILAREASLEEIREIKQNSDCEIEVFIHGGMCANYSGRCILSNLLTDRDANRGGCAQSCRWGYDFFDGNQKINEENSQFTMSSKDLNTIPYLEKLIETGVCSLKIEGRMKTGYYLACTIKAYRKLIDTYYQKGKLEDNDIEIAKEYAGLSQNRETWSGFLEKGLDGQLTINSKDRVVQDYIGDVLEIEDGQALIRVRNYFEIGQKISIIDPKEDYPCFEVTTMIDELGQKVTVANKPMQILKINFPFNCQLNDYLRRVKDDN